MWLWLKNQETPKLAKMRTVSRLERQFAALCLFYAPTGQNSCTAEDEAREKPRRRTIGDAGAACVFDGDLDETDHDAKQRCHHLASGSGTT